MWKIIGRTYSLQKEMSDHRDKLLPSQPLLLQSVCLRHVSGFPANFVPTSSLQKSIVFKLDENASSVADVHKGKLVYEHYGSQKDAYKVFDQMLMICVCLANDNKTVKASFELTLLDQSGKGVILAARSPVFKAQFYGLVGNPDLDEVELMDIEPSVFKVVVFCAMILFIYSDKLPDSYESMDSMSHMNQHLLVAADRFGLDRLKQSCEVKLCEELNVDVVETTLSLAHDHHCSQLKACCMDFAVANLRAVVQTEGFKYVEKTCPLLLSETTFGLIISFHSIFDMVNLIVPLLVSRMILLDMLWHNNYPSQSSLNHCQMEYILAATRLSWSIPKELIDHIGIHIGHTPSIYVNSQQEDSTRCIMTLANTWILPLPHAQNIDANRGVRRHHTVDRTSISVAEHGQPDSASDKEIVKYSGIVEETRRSLARGQVEIGGFGV
nr:BTB/POZ and MATH domain-containing protein 3-like isoform X1 [Tanacetum cinerariifolium]